MLDPQQQAEWARLQQEAGTKTAQVRAESPVSLEMQCRLTCWVVWSYEAAEDTCRSRNLDMSSKHCSV